MWELEEELELAEVSFRDFVGLEQVKDVVRAFRSKTAPTLVMFGCVSCSVEIEIEQNRGIRFCSNWESGEHMNMFLVSDIVTKVLQILELSTEKPEILISSQSAEDGLKALEAIRTVVGKEGNPHGDEVE